MIPLLTIEGPTASGKSELALVLARELGCEIISADSRQVYRYLDIGTAKPDPAALEEVRHHLIGIIEPSESYNVGRFCQDAGAIARNLAERGVLPLVCGGTGLYVDGLIRGIFLQLAIPADVRAKLRERLQEQGLPALYGELLAVDPEFAGRISTQDKQRILRGLEVFEATGEPISGHWRRQQREENFRCFRILLDPPRAELYRRIDGRVDRMLELGLLEEIRSLLKRGFTPQSPGLNSLGYKEFLPLLLDGAELGQCRDLAAQHTRNYAKRQCTWYRKHRFDLTLTSIAANISEVLGPIRAWLR